MLCTESRTLLLTLNSVRTIVGKSKCQIDSCMGFRPWIINYNKTSHFFTYLHVAVIAPRSLSLVSLVTSHFFFHAASYVIVKNTDR